MLQLLVSRLVAWLQNTAPGTLGLTGLLGLALLLAGSYFRLRSSRPVLPPPPGGQEQGQRQRQREGGAGGSGHAARAAHGHDGGAPSARQGEPSTSAAAQAQPRPQQATASRRSLEIATTPASRAVRSQLGGVTRITVSCAGTLLEEWQPHELQEAASVRPSAADVLREVCRLPNADVFLIAHVADDVGQAVVSGALEAAGLVGPKANGQVPVQRVLFCSTLDGKISMVRQLEPELHIDGHAATVEALKRFVPQLWHVQAPGVAPAAAGSGHVAHAPTLARFFKL
jgi:hypothetical protein